jgi:hypothetical protein
MAGIKCRTRESRKLVSRAPVMTTCRELPHTRQSNKDTLIKKLTKYL